MKNNKKIGISISIGINKRRGFTLIEIIAVIAIIGILAAVLIPNVTGYVNEARKVKVVNQARKVVTAIECFNVKSVNKIDKESTRKINEEKLKLVEFIQDKDIDLLKGDTITIADCYNLLDTENYKFTLGNNDMLISSPTAIKKVQE